MAPKKINKNFDTFIGEKIMQRRISLGMTLEELAPYTGVSFPQLVKYEKGISKIKASVLYLIAKALNVKFQYFVEGFGDSNNHTDSLYEEIPAISIQEEEKVLNLLKAYHDIHDPRVRNKLLQLMKTTPLCGRY